MRAARWVVIGTALVAAATAFHLLMSPGGGSRSGAGGGETASSGWSRSAPGATGGSSRDGSADPVERRRDWGVGPPAQGGPPLDEIDAESREAMRNFLRESAQGDNGKNGN